MKLSSLKILILIAVFLPFLSSCSEETEPVNAEDIITLEVSDYDYTKGDTMPFDSVQTWHITNKRVLVLFGYNFNEYPVTGNLKAYLGKKFGLDADGGLIYPLVYPENFRHGGRTVATDIFTILSDSAYDWAGVILLGAPENTHNGLARLQDLWADSGVPFPIVSLYSQDDILGLESTCDFVIDKGHAEILNENEEFIDNDTSFVENIPVILEDLITYFVNCDSAFEKKSNLQSLVEQILSGKRIERYSDPESGIPSINHFVLE